MESIAGLNLGTMLEVVNTSSGESFITSRVFPSYITEQKIGNSGVTTRIIEKDLNSFIIRREHERVANGTVHKAYGIIKQFAKMDPNQDLTWIYPFIKDWKN